MTGTYFYGHGRDQPCGPSDNSDLLDFANLRVFGNRNFRHQQRAVIEAVLQVVNIFLLNGLSLDPGFGTEGKAATETATCTRGCKHQYSCLVCLPCRGGTALCSCPLEAANPFATKYAFFSGSRLYACSTQEVCAEYLAMLSAD